MRVSTGYRKGVRKASAIASCVVAATSVALYTMTTGRTFIIRKLTIYNNNAAQTIVQIGTGTTALGTFVQRLIGDYVVNGQSERVIEDGLPEYEFEVAANVQASVAAAAPNNVQVQVEVDEYQGPNG